MKHHWLKRTLAVALALAGTMSAMTAHASGPRFQSAAASAVKAAGYENCQLTLDMELTARYNDGAMNADGGSMEIISYDQSRDMAYVVSGLRGTVVAIPMQQSENGQTVHTLERSAQYDLSSWVTDGSFVYGDITSVSVSPDGSKLAVAVQHADYDKNGKVAIFDLTESGELKRENMTLVDAGVQPDMVTFTPDGTCILSANEGEPRMGYSDEAAVDPAGSVTIVNTETLAAVTVGFEAFDHDTLASQGVVLKKDTAPAVDLEPEYIAASNSVAYVALQEANAIAILDLNAKQFTGVYSIGFEDHSKVALDLNGDDETYSPATYDGLLGIRMPDGISLYTADGVDYILTANEGDGRAWPVETEADCNEIKDKTSPTGNLKIDKKVTWFDASQYDGLQDNTDYLFGGRTFTMFKVTGDGLEEIFTSGSDFEEKSFQYLPDAFNCSNDNIELEDRSGKKGPEPEAVTVGQVDGKTYAFVALERIGGIAAYDITDPENVKFANYINSREFTSDIQGDVAPEGLAFVPASQGHNAMLLAACEVSGTVAVYELKNSYFQDVPMNAWYADAAIYMARCGMMNGTSAGIFSGDTAISRGMIVTILWRMAGSPAASGNLFQDVADGQYYTSAITWAAENGIVGGYGNGSFGPNDSITREQMAAILYRYGQYQQYDMAADGELDQFLDAEKVSAFADSALSWAVGAELIGGVGNNMLSPTGQTTRAQAAAILMRFCENVVK